MRSDRLLQRTHADERLSLYEVYGKRPQEWEVKSAAPKSQGEGVSGSSDVTQGTYNEPETRKKKTEDTMKGPRRRILGKVLQRKSNIVTCAWGWKTSRKADV